MSTGPVAVPSGDTGQPPEDLLLWAGGSEGQGAASASPPRAFQSPSLCGAGQGAGYTHNSCPRHLLRPSELLAQHLGDTTKNTLVVEPGTYEHPARSPLSWATPGKALTSLRLRSGWTQKPVRAASALWGGRVPGTSRALRKQQGSPNGGAPWSPRSSPLGSLGPRGFPFLGSQTPVAQAACTGSQAAD